MDGANANIQVYNSSGTNTIKLEGSTSDILLYNSSGTNTIKLDGSNGFISYPNTAISSGQALNLSSIPPKTFDQRVPWTVDLINSFGQLSPGLYSLVNLISTNNYSPIGAIAFEFMATPTTRDSYLSLMIVANNNPSYDSTAWRNNQYTGNGICLSSSNFRIPSGSATSTSYEASFPVNAMITITPDYRYLHVILCVQLLNQNWSFGGITDPTYLLSPGSSSTSGLPLYLKPLS